MDFYARYGRTKPSWWQRLDDWLVYTVADVFERIFGLGGRDWFWSLIHWLHPKHRYHVIDTGLTPGYYDPDTRIMHTMFNELKRFVRYHKLREIVNWESSDDHAAAWDEMVAIELWWSRIRPLREEAFNSAHPEPDRGFALENSFEKIEGSTMYRLKEPSKEYSEWLNKYSDMETQWQEEDRAMMKRLVDVLPYMWYP